MHYCWASENAAAVACIAGIYPVCSLASYPGIARACAAYDMSIDALAAQLARHNPIDRLASLAEAGVPILHIHGDVDDIVPLKDNSDELARRYTELRGKIELIVPVGQGHNMWDGFFRSRELVDFVIAYATKYRSS